MYLVAIAPSSKRSVRLKPSRKKKLSFIGVEIIYIVNKICYKYLQNILDYNILLWYNKKIVFVYIQCRWYKIINRMRFDILIRLLWVKWNGSGWRLFFLPEGVSLSNPQAPAHRGMYIWLQGVETKKLALCPDKYRRNPQFANRQIIWKKGILSSNSMVFYVKSTRFAFCDDN